MNLTYEVQSAPIERQGLRKTGGDILDAVLSFIRRFVCLSEPQARVVTLWTAHTYLIAAADVTPYLAITSAEKQSGKTRLLEVLEILVENPWPTGRVTSAVLVRKIHAQHPTLLLDESDAAFGGNKEYAETLRGVLNTGHRRGGRASCCVGQGTSISSQDFSTFCPKAIAGIGKLPDTVADRSIPIRLKRAAPGEVVERFRRSNVGPEAKALKDRVAAWCLTVAESLPASHPELPEALSDRQQDGAEPLLAIADMAGGQWPQLARRALVDLCTEGQAADESIGKLLLTDISQIFEQRQAVKIGSADLADSLSEIETSPWIEWSNGKPLSAARLARLLRPFDITPHSIRLEDKTPKGYERADFDDAFRRYLRAPSVIPHFDAQSATPQQANADAALNESAKRNIDPAVAASIWPKTNVYKPCCTVALSRPQGKSEEVGIEEDL